MMTRLFSLACVCFLVACAPEKPELPPISADGFDAWLLEFRRDAEAQGISKHTLNEAFADAEFIERVIELDRKQPESTLTLDEYLEKVVNAARIRKGRENIAAHHKLLKSISDQYGVAPQYIVALWGIETNYGGNTGGFSTVDALATLAFEGRRHEFFRGELLNVLRITEADGIPASTITGSWAGALGQCQFMPSSFLRYAVDHNGDGKRDIWGTQGDVFASIANYLHETGWQNDASLEDKHKVLMKWNRSTYFVTAVTQLADKIASNKAL